VWWVLWSDRGIIMCLDELADFKVTKDYGWQVFREEDGELFQLFGCNSLVPEEKWQTDPNDYPLLTEYDRKPYRTGFHLFTNKKNALYYANPDDEVVRKVRFRKIVAKGRQCLPWTFSSKANVIVVRERYVEKA